MNSVLRALRRFVLLCVGLPVLAGCTSGNLLRLASSADLINPAVRVDHDLSYGALPRQRFDVYRPTRVSDHPRPVVVFVHGGSWNWGSKDQYRFVGAALAERGAVVAVINYRLHPDAHLPESLDDVAAAVATVEQQASRLGGDPARVFLMGHSAGAELAALIALDPKRLEARGARPVQGFVGLAGPYDFTITDDYLKEYFGPPEHFPASQPVNSVSPSSAASLLVQGLKDTTVWPRNAEALAVRLRASGVPVETVMLDEDDHSTVLKRLARPYRRDDRVLAKVVAFIGAAQ
jgi:acetyl esterase/lipase